MPKQANRTLMLETLMRQKMPHYPICQEAADELKRLHNIELQFKELQQHKLAARKVLALLCICAFAGSFASSWMKPIQRKSTAYSEIPAVQPAPSAHEKS